MLLSILFGIVLIMLVVVIGSVAVSYRRRTDDAWSAAAERLGLTFDRGGGFRSRTLDGVVDGQRVRVDLHTESSGKHSATYTRYRVDYPESLGVGLLLKREGFLTGVAKFFGAQDIQVGDDEFDRGFVVKGRDELRVGEFLTPSRRVSVQRLFEAIPSTVIDDDKIVSLCSGCEREPARLADRLRCVVSVANVLTDEQAAVPVEQVPAPVVEPRAEEVEPARDPEDGVTGIDVDDSGEGDDDASAAVDRESAPSQPRGPDCRSVCEELFDPRVLSLEANKMFEERFQGAEVRWTGTLRDVNRYSFDMVFGSTPGTRAVVEIDRPDGGAFGRTAQAVLHLPPEAADELGNRRGETVEFEGRLVRCDAFLRNLFVEDASIVS